MLKDERLRFRYCDGVYVPAEDTYLMLSAVQVNRDDRVLEMGTGSGLIAVHCASAGAIVTAADVDPLAVDCAKANAATNDVIVNVVESDLFSNISGKFDLIIFNPPYLRGEAKTDEDRAWAGGAEGTDVLHRFLVEAVEHLTEGGRILIITSSDMDQGSLDKVLRDFSVKELSSMRLFFEELKVLELRPSPSKGKVRSFF
ncbi:MAG: methyltransferase [Methanomassiliicoccales archaeon]|nr:MAG: methyltransferase [Methanomassiliicoccales archaeon]